MTDVVTPPTPPASPPNPVATGDPGSGSGAGTGSAPEGFVSRAELERAQAQARDWQARHDRLAASTATPDPPKPASGGSQGFDPAEFRAQILRETLGASTLMTAIPQLRSEFPHADPDLFLPEIVADFGNVDALRLAAEDSHRRVAGILESERTRIEAEVNDRFAKAYGKQPPTGPATPPATGGAVSLDELSKMSQAELSEFERDNPGVAERLLREASGGGELFRRTLAGA